MSRRVSSILVIALLVLVVPAREASAQEGFMRWLERLSGPGPFLGGGFALPIACWRPKDASEGLKAGHCKPGDLPVQIGFELSRMKGTSDLSYAPVRPENERQITAWNFTGVYEARVRKPLDVGGAVGVMRFSGKAFNGFSRWTIEPVRATLRPLQLLDVGSNTLQKIIELRFSATWVPGGFKAEDFGAVPGTFDTDREFQGSCYIVLDFGKVIWGG